MTREEPASAQLQAVTRCLAELQTSIVATGVRAFDGWLDRLVIYTLIARMSGLTDPSAGTPISAHAIAASLGRPYETVRRHVNALVADGLCLRAGSHVRAARAGLERPHIARLMHLTHDVFVRFVEDLALAGEALPAPRANGGYHFAVGVQAVIDIMLAVIQTNREKHAGWLDLVLFSTVAAANCRATPAGAPVVPATLPVSAASVARTLALNPATVSRHLVFMTGTGQLRRANGGYLVNGDWLNHPTARAVTEQSLHNIRRLFATIAARGFPFDRPGDAYLRSRPPLTTIG